MCSAPPPLRNGFSDGAVELYTVYTGGALTGLRPATPEEQAEYDEIRDRNTASLQNGGEEELPYRHGGGVGDVVGQVIVQVAPGGGDAVLHMLQHGQFGGKPRVRRFAAGVEGPDLVRFNAWAADCGTDHVSFCHVTGDHVHYECADERTAM